MSMNTILKRCGVAAMLLGCAVLSGCVAVGWAANAVEEVSPPIKVEAEYAGLENQRVAVLVDAGLSILYQHPLAQLEVSEAISNLIAANVPGVKVVDAKQVVDFQQRNIYWNTAPYDQLAEKLGVNRLVFVELVDYRLHEPGNVNIWRGLMSANVGVAETDGERPNDLAYATQVSAAYPPNTTVGAVNADQRTIRLGTLDLFSRGVAGKFYNHTVKRSP